MPPLDNPKRERFCREYVIDGNATQAYIRAGYSTVGAEANASRLIGFDNVRARIAELQAKVSEKLELTQEKVLSDLEASRKAATAEGQHSAAIKAAELLGKHIGMWPQKLELKHDVLDGMTTDELRAARDFLEAVARSGGEAPGGDRTTH